MPTPSRQEVQAQNQARRLEVLLDRISKIPPLRCTEVTPYTLREIFDTYSLLFGGREALSGPNPSHSREGVHEAALKTLSASLNGKKFSPETVVEFCANPDILHNEWFGSVRLDCFLTAAFNMSMAPGTSVVMDLSSRGTLGRLLDLEIRHGEVKITTAPSAGLKKLIAAARDLNPITAGFTSLKNLLRGAKEKPEMQQAD
jgi:hypothetical protein